LGALGIDAADQFIDEWSGGDDVALEIRLAREDRS
jgi:hypothetical protein